MSAKRTVSVGQAHERLEAQRARYACLIARYPITVVLDGARPLSQQPPPFRYAISCENPIKVVEEFDHTKYVLTAMRYYLSVQPKRQGVLQGTIPNTQFLLTAKT